MHYSWCLLIMHDHCWLCIMHEACCLRMMQDTCWLCIIHEACWLYIMHEACWLCFMQDAFWLCMIIVDCTLCMSLADYAWCKILADYALCLRLADYALCLRLADYALCMILGWLCLMLSDWNEKYTKIIVTLVQSFVWLCFHSNVMHICKWSHGREAPQQKYSPHLPKDLVWWPVLCYKNCYLDEWQEIVSNDGNMELQVRHPRDNGLNVSLPKHGTVIFFLFLTEIQTPAWLLLLEFKGAITRVSSITLEFL